MRDESASRSRAGSSKQFFPAQDCDVQITLNGERLTAAWRPKFGPDRERSGVLHVPKATLQRLVAADEVLHLHRNSRKDVLLGDRGSKLRIEQWINRRPDSSRPTCGRPALRWTTSSMTTRPGSRRWATRPGNRQAFAPRTPSIETISGRRSSFRSHRRTRSSGRIAGQAGMPWARFAVPRVGEASCSWRPRATSPSPPRVARRRPNRAEIRSPPRSTPRDATAARMETG